MKAGNILAALLVGLYGQLQVSLPVFPKIGIYQNLQTLPSQNTKLDDGEEKEAFKQLSEQIDLLAQDINKFPNDSERFGGLSKQEQLQLKRLLRRTKDNTMELAKLSINYDVPQVYLRDIYDNADTLEEVRLSPRIGRAGYQKVNYVNNDLQAKSEYADNCPGGPFKLIKIIVHPKKGGQDTPGFQVCWVKELYEKNRRKKWNTFDVISSEDNQPRNTTSRMLPPGRYVMWTRSTDGKGTLGDDDWKNFSDQCDLINTDLIAKD